MLSDLTRQILERQAFSMRSKSWLRRAAAGALCLILCAAGLGQTAGAIPAPGTITGDFDADRSDCSLTIQYRDYDDVTFKVYRVAGVDRNVRYNWDSQMDRNNRFKDLDLVPADGKDVKDWWSLAKELAGHASKLKSPVKELVATLDMKKADVKRDATGEKYREIKLDGLYPGLYLVVGSKHPVVVQGPYGKPEVDYIEPYPILVTLPTWVGSGNSGNWVKAVVSDLRNKLSDPRDRINLQVTKIWVDNGHTHPDKVTVVLYRDGIAYETVDLSNANDWKHIWVGLDARYSWWVDEINVPAGYTKTTYWKDAYNVGIINTYSSYTPPPESSSPPHPSSPAVSTPPHSSPPTVSSPPHSNPPAVSTPPHSNPPAVSSPPQGSAPPRGSAPPEEIELDDPDVPLGDLPQTGMLWWPVPILAIAGLMLLIVGIIRRRAGGYDDE